MAQNGPAIPLSARRRRVRALLAGIILLTLPFYCVGFAFLVAAPTVLAVLNVIPPALLLPALGLISLFLLLEPFTGFLTHSATVTGHTASTGCAHVVGVGCAHPGGCLLLLILIGAIAIWFVR